MQILSHTSCYYSKSLIIMNNNHDDDDDDVCWVLPLGTDSMSCAKRMDSWDHGKHDPKWSTYELVDQTVNK